MPGKSTLPQALLKDPPKRVNTHKRLCQLANLRKSVYLVAMGGMVLPAAYVQNWGTKHVYSLLKQGIYEFKKG